MSSLHLRAAGMVTCVGLDAASSCAAMRGRLDGFAETRFMGPDAEWLVGAAVPLPRNWIGLKRMAHLAAGALSDLRRQHAAALEGAPILLCLAEEARPGRPIPDPAALARLVAEILGLPALPRLQVIAHGRPSGFVALDRARRLIAAGEDPVVILGVDSYLTAQSVAHYLAEGRLLGPGNANGFIPGEAAAAVLCTAAPGPLRLTGLGLAREVAHIYNKADKDGLDLPLRGDGMTRAYQIAMDQAQVDLAHVEYRISDLIGEQYFFKQAALASLRLERGRTPFQDLWSPAENLGNIGAAVVPVMLAQLLTAEARGYAPGSPALMEGSGDDGACGAAVFHAVRRAA
ncbi:3-oxoacyl-ACP synthase [Rhodobacter sp. SGA-6-6]|uniref:3-oxoacyl-ACP synthase n=1 Tax=Rhodobacter sp. SGA-6-6 TaxID=2710882 RepID=UPI0013EBC93E|nr:3-oxoacyl-ACP synthase [Rhodobacter sp. SGA-6-6]NGM46372.1 3-oxoacyl-ACP synthase [Rhodobacter sp. SGA-6-6]